MQRASKDMREGGQLHYLYIGENDGPISVNLTVSKHHNSSSWYGNLNGIRSNTNIIEPLAKTAMYELIEHTIVELNKLKNILEQAKKDIKNETWNLSQYD